MWKFKSFSILLFLCCAILVASKCPKTPQGTAKLVCYYEGRKAVEDLDPCACTHLVYTGEARGEELAEISRKLLEKRPKLKILLRINGKDQEIADLLKSSTIHGIDIHEAHNAFNRTRITKSTESLRTVIGSDAILMMSIPAQSELLAKYYDLKSLIKSVSMFAVETHHLGEVKNSTYHPSRLSGMWDMMNTDSVVDLVIGLGLPAPKIIVTSPANAYKFALMNNTLSTPGSPTTEETPIKLTRKELCVELNNGEKWTLERDQDLTAPYAFKDTKWLAFEDTTSMDVKGKYTRIRGLAGMGLLSIDDDDETECGNGLLQSIQKSLGSQSRAPRGAVLSSLENEILSVSHTSRLVDSIQVSPYRISSVVDADGIIHSIREDTRTEFECQRQGYFVHPRSCNRFYRCVKFNQLSDEFTVFEFDCPAGLAFDSRYEVCVWPGSLSHGQACPGSSEIAPVPQTRFICPEKPGYYADPANCRWFFACLDHGKSPLSAYEFRCPFGLGFDESKLICDWPWLVPGCGNVGKYESSAYGHGSSILTGASSFIGLSADSVNVAAHQSLVSGASTDNLIGIQSGYGSHQNGAYHDNSINHGQYEGNSGQYNSGFDQNSGNYYGEASNINKASGISSFGASTLSGSGIYNGDASNIHKASGISSFGTSGFSGSNNYNGDASNIHQASGVSSFGTSTLHGFNGFNGDASHKISGASTLSGSGSYNTAGGHGGDYSSSSYASGSHGTQSGAFDRYANQNSFVGNHQSSYSDGSDGEGNGQYYHDYTGEYKHDNSGDYKHDNTGEFYENSVPYVHVDSGNVKYTHSSGGINSNSQYNGYNGVNKYSLNNQINNGLYTDDNAYNNYGSVGSYNSGADYNKYAHSQNYANSTLFKGKYNNNYINHVTLEHSAPKVSSFYDAGSNAYSGFTATGGAHVLTAGAINSGLVGKTTLIDTTNNHKYSGNFGSSYTNQYQSVPTNDYKYDNKVEYIAQKEIPIKYVNTNEYSGNNANAYSYSQQSVTSRPVETYVKPKIFVTPKPEVYNQVHSTVSPISQVHTVTESSYKPYISSTTAQIPIYKHTEVEIERQPLVSITNYNSPVQETYHKQYESVSIANPSIVSFTEAPSVSHYPSYVSSTYKTPVVVQKTEYKNPLIHFNNVTPIPTISSVSKFVQQPSYSTYISQPTISTFQSTGDYSHAGSYNAQQNTAFHTQHNADFHSQQNNVLHTQKVVQPDSFISVSPTYETYSKQPYKTQQSYQQVNIAHVNENKYVKPFVTVSSTPKPIVFDKIQSYEYKAPEYLPPKIEYTTPAPKVHYVHPQPIKYVQPVVQQQPIKFVQSVVQQQPIKYVQPVVQQQPIKFVQPVVQQQPIKFIQPVVQQQPIKFIQPVVQQEPIKYVQPVIQQKYVSSTPQTYSSYQQVNIESDTKYVKPILTVSSTPKPYIYKAPEYLPPKIQYSTPAPIIQSVKYQPEVYSTSNLGISTSSHIQHAQVEHRDQINYSYKAPEYVSSTSAPYHHVEVAAPIKYQQSTIQHSYNTPKPIIFPAVQKEQISYENIQINNQPQYIPKIVSSTPAITHFEKTFNYQLPKVQTFQTIKYDNAPKIQISTPAPFVYQNVNHGISSSQAPQEYIKINSYKVPTTHQTYQSSTFLPKAEINTASKYQTFQSSTYLPPKTNVFESKLIQTNYKPSTEAPLVVSTFKGPDYLPPVKTKIVYKQPEYVAKYETVTQAAYKPYSSTFAVPTYPSEEFEFKKIAPVNPQPVVYKKPPVIIQQKYEPEIKYTAYENQENQVNLLGFGTVGPDAGLVHPTSSNINVQKISTYAPTITSTYAPQRYIEVTPPTIKKIRPKVAVVTKVNDFNPLLVRKLGAVCSCRSNVLQLRKPKPEYNEYETEYDEDTSINDANDQEWTYKSSSISPPSINYAIPTTYSPIKSTSPVVVRKPKVTLVSSTLNPIVVQEFDDNVNYKPIVKSTLQPIIVPDETDIDDSSIHFVSNIQNPTRRPIHVKTKVRPVTAAPTIASVLIPEYQSALVTESRPFDRYGPGGMRSRDETLQGSVDCQRVGLFRHPKHCNKFYSCRWDCTKKRFTLHVFNCPVQLSFDPNMGACNWPSQGPACQDDILLP